MLPPNRRQEPSPEELARQVADQLARSKPATARFSVRNSVLVGRLIAGMTTLVSIAVVGAGVFAGANWLLARATEPQPEVLAKTVTLDDAGDSADITTTTGLDGTLVPLAPLMFPTPLVDNGDPAAGSGATAVTIPAATTTTTSTPPTSSSVTSSTSMPATTTVQVTTSSSSSTATTAPPPPTTTVPEPTTTTVPEPTTTTTVEPTTTTTLATTTTTEATTTTMRPSPPSTPGQG